MYYTPIVGILVASLGIAIYKIQFILIYPSNFDNSRTIVDTPDSYGLDFSEEKLLTPDGEYIRLYVMPCKQPRKNLTVVFLGPNAGNHGMYLPSCHRVHQMGYNVVTLSYRGYGKSTGTPSEKGLKIDVEACLKYIADTLPDTEIVLYGRSLGGAVAIYAATSIPSVNVSGVILENTFTSIPDVVPSIIPGVFAQLAKYVVTQKWQSYKLIPKLTCKALFMAGGNDELIPPEQFKQLYDSCGSTSKQYYLYPRGMHNTTNIQPSYWEDMEAFLTTI